MRKIYPDCPRIKKLLIATFGVIKNRTYDETLSEVQESFIAYRLDRDENTRNFIDEKSSVFVEFVNHAIKNRHINKNKMIH